MLGQKGEKEANVASGSAGEQERRRPVIVCATRGGEASYPAQDRAIQEAKRRGARLIFLYVVDVDFVGDTAAPIVVDVGREVRGMGNFLLLMAKERAQAQGVESEIVIREGKVREEIPKFLQEVGADLLILGRPQAGAAKQVFDQHGVTPFAQAVEKSTGVPVMIV
ncbi:MAG TPA: universal stress protein [Caldilineae bacterium]|nr:universal stress protein [Caldilineae bacterium]